MGAGHTVTALYEVVPARALGDGELMTVKVRYKRAGRADSELASWPVRDAGRALDATSPDFRFASAVVAFGMSLRSSSHRGQASYALARQLAEAALPPDADFHRRELVTLVTAAEALAAKQGASTLSAWSPTTQP